MIGATGRYERSFENPYELLGAYISWFGMSTNTKRGGSRFEPPHKRQYFQNAVDNFFTVASLNG
jgi:hypothetical protein